MRAKAKEVVITKSQGDKPGISSRGQKSQDLESKRPWAGNREGKRDRMRRGREETGIHVE